MWENADKGEVIIDISKDTDTSKIIDSISTNQFLSISYPLGNSSSVGNNSKK